MEVDRDGFAARQAITLDKPIKKIAFTLENRTNDEHATGLWLSFPAGANYEVLQDGRPVTPVKTGIWDYPLKADLQMSKGSSKIEIKAPGTIVDMPKL